MSYALVILLWRVQFTKSSHEWQKMSRRLSQMNEKLDLIEPYRCVQLVQGKWSIHILKIQRKFLSILGGENEIETFLEPFKALWKILKNVQIEKNERQFCWVWYGILAQRNWVKFRVTYKEIKKLKIGERNRDVNFFYRVTPPKSNSKSPKMKNETRAILRTSQSLFFNPLQLTTIQ